MRFCNICDARVILSKGVASSALLSDFQSQCSLWSWHFTQDILSRDMVSQVEHNEGGEGSTLSFDNIIKFDIYLKETSI